LRGDDAANEEALEEWEEDTEACLLSAPLLAKDSEEALRDMVSGEPAAPAAPASASPACKGFTKALLPLWRPPGAPPPALGALCATSCRFSHCRCQGRSCAARSRRGAVMQRGCKVPSASAMCYRVTNHD
jgi:hypothetical protein